MIKYKIAGINFLFKYHHDAFFINNLEKYRVDDLDSIDHSIEIIYQENLNELKPTKIFVKTNDSIKSMFIADKDYKKVFLYIDPSKYNKELLAHAEYIYMGMIFLEIMFKYNFIPIHGSALSYNNEGVIIVAPSGTGKSTHAKLWFEKYLGKVIYINDDKPLLRYENNTFYIYGSPFSGENKLNNNIKIPLKSIIFIEQSQNNEIEIFDNNLKLPTIIKNILRPDNEINWDLVLNNIELLIKTTPMYRLKATISFEAVEIARNKIFKGELYEN